MTSLFIDLLKTIYAIYVKSVSLLFNKGEKKKQIVYLLSFPNNNHGLIETLNKETKVIVCYTNQVKKEARELANQNIDTWSINKIVGLFQTIKLITQSQIIIADNYFPLLADIVRDERREVIQLWHATGAIKQFGLEEKNTIMRSKLDHERFQRVYQSFTHFVVGSAAMADIFQKSYGASGEQMLYFGFPRTDYLLKSTKPISQRKQVVYLPTYRKDNMPQLADDLIKLREKLPNETDLVVKVHPTTHILNEDRLCNIAGLKLIKEDQSADDLLLKADCLITDYSSVAFDYALINPTGKLVFYWYDEKIYDEQTGIQSLFKENLPYEVCYDIDQVAIVIEKDNEDLSIFNQVWNTYNDGKATGRLLQWIKEKMDGK